VWYSVIVIVSLGNKAAREVWEKNETKFLPRELWIRAKALMTIMHSTATLDDLRIKGQPPDIRLHKLKGDRKDFWSVTIKLPWCITFKFRNGEFSEVNIENYHEG
jgi:proteic killer suppression protein